MGPWPAFGNAVVARVQELKAGYTLHANHQDVGHGWELPKTSATLRHVEDAVQAHIGNIAPDFKLPEDWLEQQLPPRLERSASGAAKSRCTCRTC